MPTPVQYYPVMRRLGLGIHDYPARSQRFCERPVGEITMPAAKLVDGKAKPCHDGVLGVLVP